MKSVVLVTGASSGFGALIARQLAKAGHIVYAGMRETNGRNAPQVEEARKYSDENKVDLRSVEMDVQSEASVEKSIQTIVAESGRLDILIHNAGHMVYGPAEAFTPEQLSDVYDINVVSTQRVNRAALPVLRKQGKGLVLWIGSSSTRGGTPPIHCAVLCRQGRYGCFGGKLCRRTRSLEYRNLHHRSGRLHFRYESFRPRRTSRRPGESQRICYRSDRRA